MGLSYYPNRIRTFPTHRNLLDDVDAAHVNSIQDELFAVMFSLGVAPQVYNNIETNYVSTTATPADPGGVIDDDTVYTPTARYYDPNVKPIDHGTVGQRLDDIERMQQVHAFRLKATGLDAPTSSNTLLTTRPKGIRFPKPSADMDPYDMHNGVGVTLRKSGFWFFSGTVVYTLLGSTAGSNDGVYQAAIDYDQNWLEGMARGRESGNDDHPILNPHLMGFFTRGTRISLRTSHDSGRTQKIRLARLAGMMVRESIDA